MLVYLDLSRIKDISLSSIFCTRRINNITAFIFASFENLYFLNGFNNFILFFCPWASHYYTEYSFIKSQMIQFIG